MSPVEIFASFVLMNPTVPAIDVHIPMHNLTTLPAKEQKMHQSHPGDIDNIMLSIQKGAFIRRFAVIEQDFDIAFPPKASPV